MAQESRDNVQNAETENDLLSSAATAASEGHVQRARLLLGLLLRQEPDNEHAWLELARLYQREPAPDQDRMRDCLQQVLRIHPQHRMARSMLRELDRVGRAKPDAEAQPEPAQLTRATAGRTTLGARGIYLLIAGALVLLSALVVLSWAVPGSPLALATRTPTPTLTPPPTATPAATPTPSIPDRVAQQIPLLEQAWNERDWAAAIRRLAQISALDADYPGLRAAQCETYVHWANELKAQCQIERAHELYRRAIAACENRADVYQAKTHALLYLSGKWRYDRQRWPQAVQVLQELYVAQPEYAAGCQEPLVDAGSGTGPASLGLDVQTLLHDSLVASSRQYLEQNQLERALQAAQGALALAPEDAEVIQLFNTIQLKLRPPLAPTPRPLPSTGKQIEVSISEQRMYVWQGETLLHDWVVSTGKQGSGTAAGLFRVQSKIPEAWGGQWSLRMPHWLGIYWVGTIENGIHALPINANGTTLWEGYLGTPVSFGCIILSTENAQTLYDWADIGTPVWIHD